MEGFKLENSSDTANNSMSRDSTSDTSIFSSLFFNIAYPAVFIVGILGNLLTFIVCRHLNSLSVYLSALAASDSALVTVEIVLYFFSPASLHSSSAAEMVCKAFFSVSFIFGAWSAWLHVAVTMQRTLSIVFPHNIYFTCTRRKSKLISFIIAITIAIIYIYIIYTLSVDMVDSNSFRLYLKCSRSRNETVDDDLVDRLKYTWIFMDMIISSVLPFMLLLVCNIFLVKTVVGSVRDMNGKLESGQPDQVVSRERKAISMTHTLILLSTTFFLLTAPIAVFPFAKSYISHQETFSQDASDTLEAFFELLYMSNSAINFYLYFKTGTAFRGRCLEIFRTCCSKIKSRDRG